MRHFKTLSFWLASSALAMSTMVGVASADPIMGLNGTTSDSTAAYLKTANGTPGVSLVTYSVGMPAYTCAGGNAGCILDPGPGTFVGTGYHGSIDQTWLQATGGIMQSITWGTTNGNLNPVRADTLNNGFDLFPLDGQGNPVALTGGSLLSWGSSYSLGDNGTWDGTTRFIGVNSDSNATTTLPDTVFLYFSTPIAGFSALFNFNPDAFTTATVSAFDATGTQIPLNSNTIVGANVGTNTGVILGFLDAMPDISFIVLTDANAVMANVSITYGEPAPEPITLALLGSGLAGLGLARRYRRSRQATSND